MVNHAQNVETVFSKIKSACNRSGREVSSIKVVCVSKTQTIKDIQSMNELGLLHFGENRPSELSEKYVKLMDRPINWNFIGNLQSNQINNIVQCSNIIHSVTNLRHAILISDAAAKLEKNINVFLQVNISGETSKSGYELSNWEKNAEDVSTFVTEVINISNQPNLKIIGLMMIAPNIEDKKELKNIFLRTKSLANHLNEMKFGTTFKELSMGMSNDYEIAIENGATFVRIGSAFFK